MNAIQLISQTAMKSELQKKVIELIEAAIKNRNKNSASSFRVDPEALLESFGLDSIDFAQLEVSLEDLLNIPIESDIFYSGLSIAEISGLLCSAKRPEET